MFPCDGSCEITRCGLELPTQVLCDAHKSGHCHFCYDDFFGRTRVSRLKHLSAHIPREEESKRRGCRDCGDKVRFFREGQIDDHLSHGLCLSALNALPGGADDDTYMSPAAGPNSVPQAREAFRSCARRTTMASVSVSFLDHRTHYIMLACEQSPKYCRLPVYQRTYFN
jgi:hypothetical protein